MSIEELKRVVKRGQEKRRAAMNKELEHGVELPAPVMVKQTQEANFVVAKAYFSETQLRDYGDRRAAAERERCAQVCIGIANRPSNLILGTAIKCAEAIRKG